MKIFRRIIEILALLILGFLLGISHVSELTLDIIRSIRLDFAMRSITAAPGSSIFNSIAGLLIGPGLFILLRDRVVNEWPMMRVRWAEATSGWDNFAGVATRFGIAQYLDRCAKWGWRQKDLENGGALVLFRIVGLGSLNSARGSAIGTRLLAKIAWKMRAQAVPQTANLLHGWVGQQAPWVLDWDSSRPVFGMAGRWSGSTFAIAFREVEVQDVVRLTLKVTGLLRDELKKAASGLDLRVGFAVAPAHGASSALQEGAEKALAAADDTHIPMAYAAPDTRASLVEAGEIMPMVVEIPVVKPEEGTVKGPHTWVSLVPGLALIAAGVLLAVFGVSKGEYALGYPWPETMSSALVVDEKGSREVALTRTRLADQEQAHWHIGNVLIEQSKDYEPRQPTIYVHVTVTNLDSSTRYVSLFNLKALDAAGHEWDFSPSTLKMAQPFSDKWLGEQQTLDGWLVGKRGPEPIVGIVFSRETQITLRDGK
jgi:GGDEF domain-containing protein